MLSATHSGIDKEPDYRVWLMDSVKPQRWLSKRPGQWIAEPRLPAPDIQNSKWHCSHHSSEIAGALNQGSAAEISIDISSPQTCGQNTGEYFPFTFGPELPDDQTEDDLQSVCFDSPALASDIDIVGAPGFHIQFTSDQPQAMIAVRLCDCRPDGTSALITPGVLNLTHRKSSETPQALLPGETHTATITLDQIAYRIGKGHKLRIALSTTYWPFIWPSPVAATLTLTRATLSLPERTADQPDKITFEPPVAAPGWQVRTLRQSSSSRHTGTDTTTGEMITRIDNDFGETLDLDHGLRTGSKVTEIWSIHPDDPLSAKAQLHWQQTGGRDDWHWRTDAHTTMHSDTENFYVTARLKVVSDGKTLVEKEFHDTIERGFL